MRRVIRPSDRRIVKDLKVQFLYHSRIPECLIPGSLGSRYSPDMCQAAIHELLAEGYIRSETETVRGRRQTVYVLNDNLFL